MPGVGEPRSWIESTALCTIVLLAIAAVPQYGCEASGPGSAETREVAAGATMQPTNGLVLAMIASKTRFKAGDDIEITETLKNVSGHEIWENFRAFKIGAEELAFYPPVYGLPAVEKTSATFPFVKNSRPRPILLDIREAPGLPQAVITSKHFASRLTAGATLSVAHRFKIFRPGIYRFSATWTSSYAADHADALWRGNLDSNPVEITIAPGGK